MGFLFPRVYPILDSSFIPAQGRELWLQHLGQSLTDAGVTLLEYRNKVDADDRILADCAILRDAMPPGHVRLILDDRADLVLTAGFDGVHVDAGDPSPAEARLLLGPNYIIGTFGGAENLLPGILKEPADYFAIGPVFPTTTKDTIKKPIGFDGVARLRSQAGPDPTLVAVAGITLSNAAEVIASGANTVAVSAGIFSHPHPAKQFRLLLDFAG